MAIVALSTRDERLTSLIRGPLPYMETRIIDTPAPSTLELRQGSMWVNQNRIVSGIQGDPEVYRFGVNNGETSFSPVIRARVLIATATGINDPSVNASESTIGNIRGAYRAGLVLGQRVRFSPTEQRFIPVNARFVPISQTHAIPSGTELAVVHLVCYGPTQITYQTQYILNSANNPLHSFRVRIIDYSALGIEDIHPEQGVDSRAYYEPAVTTTSSDDTSTRRIYYSKVFNPGLYTIDFTSLIPVARNNPERLGFIGDCEPRFSSSDAN